MVSRFAGARRVSITLLVCALFTSLVQVVHVPPTQAVTGEFGPAVVPGSSTAGLTNPSPIANEGWSTKNQHRIWWNSAEARWDAVLPTPTGWQIMREAIPKSFNAAPLGDDLVSANSSHRPDVYWDDTAKRLYILMSGNNTTLFVYDYVAGDYQAAFTTSLGSVNTTASRAAVYKDHVNGDIWVSVINSSGLVVTRSTDDGVSFATTVPLIIPVDEGQTQLTSFTSGSTNYLAVAAAEGGDLGLSKGRYSKYLFYKLDLANVGNWSQATFASATLNIVSPVIAGETVTVGAKTYTFQTTVTEAEGNVAIGADAAASASNLVAAINGACDGTTCATANRPHPEARSMIGSTPNTVLLGAKESGTVGNLALTDGLTGAGNEFEGNATSMSGGASAWTSEHLTITQTSTTGVVHSDDEISLVTHQNVVYLVTETERTCIIPDQTCMTGQTSDPQVVLFRRATNGTWTQSNVKLDQTNISGDRKRPVVAILNDTVYVIAVDNNLSNSSYWSTPVDSIPSLGNGWGTPTPLFSMTGESVRNNVVPRFPTNSTSGLPILVDNISDRTVWQTKLPKSAANNQPPSVYAGPDLTDVNGLAVTPLNGQATDDTGTPIVAWSKISGPGNVVFANQAQATTTATFSAIGSYVLRLTATEPGAASTHPLSNYDEVTVTVSSVTTPPPNPAPTLTVSKPTNNASFKSGTAVQFQASASDSGANVSSQIKWTSSRDGAIGTGASFNKSNLSVGSHVITVSITDGVNTTKVTRNITITNSGGGTPQPTPDNPFIDDDGHLFENDIEWLAAQGITKGCGPARFCPNDRVTRGQMAAFLVRAFGLTQSSGNLFNDDNGHLFENDINKLATAGVTKGCGPKKFCPNNYVTRGQMAAFLVRAFGYTATSGTNLFGDDNGHLFEKDIDKLATAGVTKGCGPNRFCPNDYVTRGQMAAFLRRAMTG